MGRQAKILADSISPNGIRLTTFEVTFPRIILAEVNTHRMLSRNSASSRAIPVEKMIKRVQEDPYVPSSWGKNQKGMQAGEELTGRDADDATITWLGAKNDAIYSANRLLECGVHKQLTNRLLEPFMWHTAIITATEWSNFFNLRAHKDAHPDFRMMAEAMKSLLKQSEPEQLGPNDWHLPLVGPEYGDPSTFRTQSEKDLLYWVKVSAGRCARVSYLTHDGNRDPIADVTLAENLTKAGHMSPLEHPATPMSGKATHFEGNFRGWVQYRKLIHHEHDPLGAPFDILSED